jgi:hypothetical protein
MGTTPGGVPQKRSARRFDLSHGPAHWQVPLLHIDGIEPKLQQLASSVHGWPESRQSSHTPASLQRPVQQLRGSMYWQLVPVFTQLQTPTHDSPGMHW